MLDGLERGMPKCVKFTRPCGGLFIWCTLPDGADAPAFIAECMKNKVAVVPGGTFNCDLSRQSNGFRLNYSTPSDEQIVLGIEKICKVAREMLGE